MKLSVKDNKVNLSSTNKMEEQGLTDWHFKSACPCACSWEEKKERNISSLNLIRLGYFDLN